MLIDRFLRLALARSKKSVLLLGPRQTGKSTLISQLHPDVTINMAHEATYLDFARNPREIEQRLSALTRERRIFIDEIQRLPSLLNTLQVILDKPENPFQFFLTGSSARKLKRGHANLLPGRLHTYFLGPITSGELGYEMNTQQVLSAGSLPGILTESDPREREKTLRSYAGTYLKEEVQAENLTRNLEGFARFLQVTAEWAGLFLDLSKMASAAQVARQSAVRFFEVLEDCLIVLRLSAFSKSISRRLIQHPKFYFFDVGVLNGLLGNFHPSADRIGVLFEHLVTTQIFHSAQSRDLDIRLSTFRTEHGAEVDVIVEIGGAITAIEIKASRHVGREDVRGLERFADYVGKKHQRFVFYLGDQMKEIDGIPIVPWQIGLRKLGL